MICLVKKILLAAMKSYNFTLALRRESDSTLKKSKRTSRRREYPNQGDGLSILETGSLISRGGEFGRCDACLGNTEFFSEARAPAMWEYQNEVVTQDEGGCQALSRPYSVGC